MSIEELEKNWDGYGNIDPLFAILDKDKNGNPWNTEDFFQTGVAQINDTMSLLSSLNIKYKNEKALDFGCGIGRLSQALCPYFNEVYGVDIASSMIDLANRYNQYPDKCKYIINIDETLKIFKDCSLDFIYTYNVLQHIKPINSKRYIEEFFRIIKPNGIIIFHIPIRYRYGKILLQSPLIFYKQLRNYYKEITNQPKMEMHVIYKSEIEKIIQENKGKILYFNSNKDIFVSGLFIVRANPTKSDNRWTELPQDTQN